MRSLLCLLITLVSVGTALSQVSSIPTWQLISSTPELNMVAFDWQGGMYGITTAGGAVYRQTSGQWDNLLPRFKAKFISIDPDGTVNVLPASGNVGYFRVNGKWEQRPGSGVEQIVADQKGRHLVRLTDGTVTVDGIVLPLKGKFQFVSVTPEGGVYLAGTDNKLYTVGNGGFVTELIGKGTGKMVVGNGYAVRGGILALGVGSDANVYFFEVYPTNKFSLLPGVFMKQLAVDPKGTFYGVSADSKLYKLTGSF